MASKKFQNFVGKVFTLSQHQVIVEDLVAEGGFALVFLVKSTRSEDRFALKRLYVNNKQDLAVCKREINISQGLSGHKNIVAYVDSSINLINNNVYEVLLLMQYCQGRAIDQLAEKQGVGGFSESEVLKIFCDVCEAVAHIHHCQTPIIHRDIKVENVLQSTTGDYVLCDFGSAVFDTASGLNVQQMQDELNRFTTLSYRSPEMVDLYSGKHIGTKSDIWALGCLLYRLCFCTLPFGESILAIQRGLVTIPNNSPYSAHLHALIGYLLQVDCDVRPDICQASYVAFKLARRQHCPVRNLNNVRIPDISTLPVPQSESELKQQSTQRPAASRRAGAGAASEVESTAINPRPRPRAADSASKPPTVCQPLPPQVVPQQTVSTNTSSVMPTVHQTALPSKDRNPVNTTPVCTNGLPVSSPLSSEISQPAEPVWHQWEQLQTKDDPSSSKSLIDFDSSGMPMSSRIPGVAAVGANSPMFVQNCQYVPYSMPWGPTGFVQHPAVNAMRYWSPPQRFVVPGQANVAVSYCGASGFNQSLRYPAGPVGQAKTGSINELHLMQTDSGSATGNRPPQQTLATTVMKHRRISSDTSALHSLLSLNNHKQPVSMTSNLSDVKQSSSLHSSMQPLFDEGLFAPSHVSSSVTSQVADWNPFAEDNFGSLTKEDIFAKQLHQPPQSSDIGFATDLFDTRHKRSSSDTAKLGVGVGLPPMQSSSPSVSPLARR